MLEVLGFGLGGSCFFTGSVAGAAEDSARICLVSSWSPSTQLDEAHHRIVAELGAVGFVVQDVQQSSGGDPRVGTGSAPTSSSTVFPGGAMPEECADAEGLLVLQAIGQDLTILAAAPDEDPLIQRMNLRSDASEPEVIAIRAVEGLRAALIQAVRKREGGAAVSPAAVRDFTHLGVPPSAVSEPSPDSFPESIAPPLVAETATERSVEPPDVSGPRTAPELPPPFLVAFGPGIALDGGSAGATAELLLAWRPGWIAVGALVDATLAPGSLTFPEGSVAVRQYSFLGRFAGDLPCGKQWVCQVGVDFGVRQLVFDPTAIDATSSGAPADHTSALLSGDALAGYFFSEHFGFGAQMRAGSLLDVPRVSSPSTTHSWGRPSLGGSLSLMGRF